MNAPVTIEQLRAEPERRWPPPDPDAPYWLSAHRITAAGLFGRRAFPQRHDEEWRYTPVDKLLTQPFMTAADAALAPDRALPEQLPQQPPLSASPACRLVFVNGRLLPAVSDTDSLPNGATVTGLAEAIASMPDRVSPWLGRVPQTALHSFSALNSAQLHDGLFIHIEAGCRLERPIEVLHLGQPSDEPVISHPRTVVVLKTNAEATLIERYIGVTDTPYFHNGVSEIQLQPGARLSHHRLQQQSTAAWHLDALFVNQQRDSRYTASLFALGGRWSRNEVHIAFQGEGATCDLGGAYTVGDGQLNDLHIDIEHRLPRCRSEVRFRGLLHGKGRGVFDGRILVAADAQHSDAHLNNANLLLERSAEIDTKPQLEILADDVRCSHGATVGQLDPDQLFYLRSRGIGERQARRMLALGFAATALERCDIAALRDAVEHRIAARLDCEA